MNSGRYFRAIKLIALALVIILPSKANATDPTPPGGTVFFGFMLRAECRKTTNFCKGYILGVVDQFVYSIKDDKRCYMMLKAGHPNSFLDSGLDIYDLASIVEAYLDANEKTEGDDAAKTVLDALAQRFPCPQ